MYTCVAMLQIQRVHVTILLSQVAIRFDDDDPGNGSRLEPIRLCDSRQKGKVPPLCIGHRMRRDQCTVQSVTAGADSTAHTTLAQITFVEVPDLIGTLLRILPAKFGYHVWVIRHL